MKQFERLKQLEEALMQPALARTREEWIKHYKDAYGRTKETFAEDIAELNKLLNEKYNEGYEYDDRSTKVKYVYVFRSKYCLLKDTKGYFYSYFSSVQDLRERQWQHLANVIEYHAELFDETVVNKFMAYQVQRSSSDEQVITWNPVSLLNNGQRPGKNYFPILLEAIQQGKAVKIEHQSVDPRKASTLWTLMPLLLKEYTTNNYFISGWYVLANELDAEEPPKKVEIRLNKLRVFALDRIKHIELLETKVKMVYAKDFDPNDYFKHALGVFRQNLKNQFLQPEKVVIQTVKKEEPKQSWIYHYLKKYPIHPSMKIIEDDGNNFLKLQFNLEIDQELEDFLFKYARDIEVVSPKELRDEIMKMLNEANSIYKKSL
jgi:predicted DNA-binding transcriptional regulator YafY